MTNWPEIEATYFMRTFRRLPVVAVRGQGCRVWDENGKEYLDFMAGWAVCNLGHCHPVQVEAIRKQAGELITTSPALYTIPSLQLAELLVQQTGLARVFLANSGAEANEGAIKLARKWGKLNRGGAYEVITALHSFHGRTLAMVAATGKWAYKVPFTPMPQGFTLVEYNDINAIKAVTTDRTVAVMLEPIQGEGGVNLPHPDYFPQVREWCDSQGLLLILDEVQTGFGRTGALFAKEWLGVQPDVMTLAKGLGNGVPIGAFLASERAAVLEPGDHGSTYGGNALCSAAAYAVTKYIVDKDVSGHAGRMGDYFTTQLEGLRTRQPHLVAIRGRGLLIAAEFDRDVAQSLVNTCLEHGLILNPVTPTAIRFMPPLIVEESDIDEAIGIVEQAIAHAYA